MGGASATGQFLDALFRDWPGDLLFDVWVEKGAPVGARRDSTDPSSGEDLVSAVKAFDAELVFFRPDARSESLLAINDAIDDNVPRVINIVDDWIARLRADESPHADMWDSQLESLVASSFARFAISPELGSQLAGQYGAPFDVISNVIDPADWLAPPPVPDDGPTSFRFSGQLAYMKGGSSLAAIALGVEGATNVDAELIIRNGGTGHERNYVESLGSLSRVRIEPFADDPADYRGFLAGADVNVVAFNMDEATRTYLRGSFANRVPELLAAGRPILAIGPTELATMRFLAGTGAAITHTSIDAVDIHRMITKLSTDEDLRQRLAENARVAASAFDRGAVIPDFYERLRTIAAGEQSNRVHGPRAIAERQRPVPPVRAEDHAPSTVDLDRLRAIRGIHAGETCVVVGNGPSLNETDLSLLDDQIVFASNAIFLLFDEVAWRPQYYASVDSRFLPDRHPDVEALLRAHPEMTGFFPTVLELHDGSDEYLSTRQLLPELDNRVLFWSQARKPNGTHSGAFSLDATAGLIQPSTVTVTLMQLAFHMGFSRIVLIGCDTSYSIPKTVEVSGPQAEGQSEGMLLTSTQDDDVNHFRPDYFGAGRAWHHPKVDHMIRHYEAAKTVLDLQGVEVINSTVGGALEVYPRLPLDKAIA